MASEEESDSGPVVQFSWNFPLVRILTTRASSVTASVKNREPVVRDRVTERLQNEEDAEEQEDAELTDIRDRLSDIREGRSADVAQSDDEGPETVGFDSNVFVPVRTRADVGDEVTWSNTSDEDITLVFDDGNTINIPSGDEGSRQFNVEGAVQYNLQNQSPEDVCGVVLVGDGVASPDLPCEGEVDRVLFQTDEQDTINVSAPSSMSKAAEEKEELKP